MCIELIKAVSSARELRDLLNEAPDYLLDVPITLAHEDSNLVFHANGVEVIDIIEGGARVMMVRISGEGSEM